jgi:hypothetical protein
VPYSNGRWYWTSVGWNWIPYEPWGWYPFHYGSWNFDASFGWVWGWDPVWSPAWVYWIYSPGYVGWCPRGYYDWWFYNQCTHCWGQGWRYPGRWSEVAFDFSGRVRLSGIDPHPWTFVSAGQFTSTHLERVRLEPGRFLRGQPEDGTALVRSGPLITPAPGRGSGDRNTVESYFRGNPTTREVPDLSSILRREPLSGGRNVSPVPGLRPSRTNDMVTGVRLQVPGGAPSGTAREGTVDRWGRGSTTGGTPGAVRPVDRTGDRPYGGVRARTGRDGADPPSARPDAAGRTASHRDGVAPPSRGGGTSRDTGSVRDAGSGHTAGSSSGRPAAPPPSTSSPPPPPPPPPPPASSAPPPPPPARQPSRELSGMVRRRDPLRWQADRTTGERTPVTIVRREVTSSDSARVYTVEPRTTSRSFEGYRAAPREVVRPVAVHAAPVATTRGAASPSYVPRASSPPSAVSSPRTGSPAGASHADPRPSGSGGSRTRH